MSLLAMFKNRNHHEDRFWKVQPNQFKGNYKAMNRRVVIKLSEISTSWFATVTTGVLAGK